MTDEKDKPQPTFKEAWPGCLIIIVLVLISVGIGYCALRDPKPVEIATQRAPDFANAERAPAAIGTLSGNDFATYSSMICEILYESAAEYGADIGWADKDISDFGPNKKTVIIDGKMQNGFGAWMSITGYCNVFEDGDVIDFALKRNNRGNPLRPYSDEELTGLSASFRQQWNANN